MVETPWHDPCWARKLICACFKSEDPVFLRAYLTKWVVIENQAGNEWFDFKPDIFTVSTPGIRFHSFIH
jgi:hypothetical protein